MSSPHTDYLVLALQRRNTVGDDVRSPSQAPGVKNGLLAPSPTADAKHSGPPPSARASPQHHRPELRAGPQLNAAPFKRLRRRAILEGCKWDPQVGDVATLAPFPLIIRAPAWSRLAHWAEQLAAETVAAEEEIIRRPELIRVLGLPRKLQTVLLDDLPVTPAPGRIMRFDFHPTAQGWRISEVNSDVPGGFTESSLFTEMIAEHFPQLRPAGNPGDVWSDLLANHAGRRGTIALLSATGHMEDHEVVAFLAARLRERGCQPHLANPNQILWRDSRAHLNTAWYQGQVNGIVRFYQAEWLARLPQQTGWRNFFRGGRTLVANSMPAVISESKRFPLTWDKLRTPMSTWRALLPETRDPREAPWASDQGWLLKTALCNNGDTVSIRELMPAKTWLGTCLAAFLRPNNWVAQRRFESLPLCTPIGLRHLCIGVYTVDGCAAGAYGRFSEKPVVDFAATDVAVLIEDDD
ncbi:MAG: glutathionylspermidine synthase [Verrucomicrobia bacterium]|nr:MAG: glutathionylspermidine synthase [Verrucomicrobiota bacterium]